MTYQTQLLINSLTRTLDNPTDWQRWHALYAAMQSCDDIALRQHVLQQVRENAQPEGVAGFLSATLLAALGGEPGDAERAGRLARGIVPVDLDRLSAFACYEWGLAVRSDAARDQFIQRLTRVGVPELMALAGSQLRGAMPAVAPPPRVAERVQRVALLAFHLSDSNHPPSGMAVDCARLLHDAGLQVQLFSCQEMQVPDMARYLAHAGEFLIPPTDHARLATLIPRGVLATLSDTALSLKQRWIGMRQAIADYDADLILFVGLMSPLVAMLYPDRPVLGLCVHAVQPLAPVDVWLCADAALAGTATRAWGDTLPPALAHHHPYRLRYRQAAQPRQRADWGVTAQQRLLVSVGGRLADEISGPWAARMTALLARRPDVVWLLVGGNATLPPALAGAPATQLRLLPHQGDINAILPGCDIYINPPRLGGGFSVAEAMAQGLPVLALADSDGGNKLGAQAVPDADTYFALLERYLDSATLRAEHGAALRQHFERTLDLDRSTPSLLAACALTLSRFRLRSQDKAATG